MRFVTFMLSFLLVLSSNLAFSDVERSDTLAGDEGLQSLWRRVLSCADNSLKVQVELVNGRGTRIVVAGRENVAALRKAGAIGQVQNEGNELVLDSAQAFKGTRSVADVVCPSDFNLLKRRYTQLTYDDLAQTVDLVVTDAQQLPAGANLPAKTYKLSFANCRAHGTEDFPSNNRDRGVKNQFELAEDSIVFAKAGALINRDNCRVE